MNTNEARRRVRAREGVSGTENGLENDRRIEGSEKGRQRDREGANDRHAKERQPEPRRQSSGSFVTVMASTPGLQPPGLAPLLVYR